MRQNNSYTDVSEPQEMQQDPLDLCDALIDALQGKGYSKTLLYVAAGMRAEIANTGKGSAAIN